MTEYRSTKDPGNSAGFGATERVTVGRWRTFTSDPSARCIATVTVTASRVDAVATPAMAVPVVKWSSDRPRRADYRWLTTSTAPVGHRRRRCGTASTAPVRVSVAALLCRTPTANTFTLTAASTDRPPPFPSTSLRRGTFPLMLDLECLIGPWSSLEPRSSISIKFSLNLAWS